MSAVKSMVQVVTSDEPETKKLRLTKDLEV